MLSKRTYLMFFFFIAFAGYAQENIPTGTWRVHLPYADAFEITETPDALLIIADFGSYRLVKSDASLERLSKIQGFSEVQMNVAKYNFKKNVLVIAYKNGNIDLIKGNRIINISSVLNSNIIQGIKQINHIHFYENDAFLSTNFGLLVLDLDKEEIKESYTNIGPGGSRVEIKACATLMDSIYVATPVGVFAAKNSPGVILGQFTNWKLLGAPLGANHIAAYNNTIYADSDTNFSRWSNGWIDIGSNGKDELQSLEVNHGKLVAALNGGIQIFNTTGLEKTLNVNAINKAILNESGEVWFVVRGFGLIKKTDQGEVQLVPNGPASETSFGMLPVENSLLVVGGGHNRGFDPLFDNAGYYRFEKGTWFNKPNNPITDVMRDFTNPAYSKKSKELIIATQSTGILTMGADFIPRKVYNASNSSLKANPANGFLICNGAAFDKNDNLWVSNSSNIDSALVVRTADETWKAFRFAGRPGKIVVDNNNNKWIITPQNNATGIVIYNDNNTPLNVFDDVTMSLSSAEGSGKLINNNVVSLSLDKDNEMWIGTTQGICVIRNTNRIFEQGVNFDAERLIITQGNQTDYLLGDEVINDIEVDGGNRKWIATSRGVFLITENGDSILKRFNASNSPLLSDLVLNVGIDPNTGEVFFGTQEGIISYRGNATEPREDFSQVKVFPNPVPSNFRGDVTITNLKDNALVKITDLSGQLVFEGFANGGTFIWNGNNMNNQRVSSGVYFVLMADKEVEETDVAKILFLK